MKRSIILFLAYWLLVCASPAFPASAPDCCKNGTSKYCPMKHKPIADRTSQPSCHEGIKKTVCTFDSTCSHSQLSIVFWFDGILKIDGQINSVSSTILKPLPEIFPSPDVVNIETPPPKSIS